METEGSLCGQASLVIEDLDLAVVEERRHEVVEGLRFSAIELGAKGDNEGLRKRRARRRVIAPSRRSWRRVLTTCVAVMP
jgi:hypothetical protein